MSAEPGNSFTTVEGETPDALVVRLIRWMPGKNPFWAVTTNGDTLAALTVEIELLRRAINDAAFLERFRKWECGDTDVHPGRPKGPDK